MPWPWLLMRSAIPSAKSLPLSILGNDICGVGLVDVCTVSQEHLHYFLLHSQTENSPRDEQHHRISEILRWQLWFYCSVLLWKSWTNAVVLSKQSCSGMEQQTVFWNNGAGVAMLDLWTLCMTTYRHTNPPGSATLPQRAAFHWPEWRRWCLHLTTLSTC